MQRLDLVGVQHLRRELDSSSRRVATIRAAASSSRTPGFRPLTCRAFMPPRAPPGARAGRSRAPPPARGEPLVALRLLGAQLVEQHVDARMVGARERRAQRGQLLELHVGVAPLAERVGQALTSRRTGARSSSAKDAPRRSPAPRAAAAWRRACRARARCRSCRARPPRARTARGRGPRRRAGRRPRTSRRDRAGPRRPWPSGSSSRTPSRSPPAATARGEAKVRAAHSSTARPAGSRRTRSGSRLWSAATTARAAGDDRLQRPGQRGPVEHRPGQARERRRAAADRDGELARGRLDAGERAAHGGAQRVELVAARGVAVQVGVGEDRRADRQRGRPLRAAAGRADHELARAAADVDDPGRGAAPGPRSRPGRPGAPPPRR